VRPAIRAALPNTEGPTRSSAVRGTRRQRGSKQLPSRRPARPRAPTDASPVFQAYEAPCARALQSSLRHSPHTSASGISALRHLTASAAQRWSTQQIGGSPPPAPSRPIHSCTKSESVILTDVPSPSRRARREALPEPRGASQKDDT